MTDWKTMADIFATAQRHMKLTGEAQHAASTVGSLLHRLAAGVVSENDGETRPFTDAEYAGLLEQLRQAQEAFERVKPHVDT